ncbi:MAG: hypothetical protein ACRD8Z_22670 [Nitrososphaeraceae archaeon]
MNSSIEDNSKQSYSYFPRILEYRIPAFMQICINNLASRYYGIVLVPQKEQNLEVDIVSGVLLVAHNFLR